MHAITADRLHRPESVRDRLRRGGPLLDFISANFLYILTAVAVLGVAAGAYATFERNSYSNDLRSIMTSIIQYASAGKRLNQMTFNDLRRVVPPNIDVDTADGMVYFGGLLGDGLPMYIYGGEDDFAELGAGSQRQLIMVVGDANTAANDSEGVCISLARTVGPAVKLIQLKTAPASQTATQKDADDPITEDQAVADTESIRRRRRGCHRRGRRLGREVQEGPHVPEIRSVRQVVGAQLDQQRGQRRSRLRGRRPDPDRLRHGVTDTRHPGLADALDFPSPRGRAHDRTGATAP